MPLTDTAHVEIGEACDEYEKTGTLTTTIMLAGLCGRSEIPRTVSIVEDIDSIQNALKTFNATIWPTILATNLLAKKRGFRFRTKEIELLSLCTAGRILITLRYRKDKKKGYDQYLSVVGGEEESCKGCGLQGLYVTKEKAIELVSQVVRAWDAKKYRPYTKVSIW